jgi:beta-glucosidase
VACDGIPATANRKLLDEILRGELGFGGMLVSDWQTILNLVRSGVAEDLREAARMALEASLDVDMFSHAYARHLPELVRRGVVAEGQLDAAVRRVLAAKERVGLFADPFRGCDESREREVLLCTAHRATAREVARGSFVLLQNHRDTLPLTRGACVAVVGPLAKERRSPLGWWEGRGRAEDTVSLWDGLREVAGPGTRLLHAEGCRIDGFAPAGEELIAPAVEVASQADVVVAALGEWFDMSGEAGSRAGLDLPGAQRKLLEALAATGKPLALVVYSGRPLVLTAECELAAAVLLAWQPGTMGGAALADVLFGDHPPTGKLPVTLPRHPGQVPCYYGHRRSCHPRAGEDRYLCRSLDVTPEPLFPFGHGLGYTRFELGPPCLSAERLQAGETLEVMVTVHNRGPRHGREVVQLYLTDEVCEVLRPERELKDFAAVDLAPGTSGAARFTLRARDLRHLGPDGQWRAAPGWFTLATGPDSRQLQTARFCLTT